MAGDEVYGRSSKLREACEQAGKGYVLAVPVNLSVTLPSGRPEGARIRRGRHDPGHGVGDPLVRARLQRSSRLRMGLAGTASPRHWVLIRRSLSDLKTWPSTSATPRKDVLERHIRKVHYGRHANGRAETWLMPGLPS